MCFHKGQVNSTLLTRLLLEFPGFAPSAILIVFFFAVNFFVPYYEFPPKYPTFNYRLKADKINDFGNFGISDVNYRPNYIACST
jgi:hypothetical protein